MLVDQAATLNAWFQRHNRIINLIGWMCFAVISANHAHLIDLPTFVAVPLWAGFIGNLLRWGLWEGLLKPKAHSAMMNGTGADATQSEGDLPL